MRLSTISITLLLLGLVLASAGLHAQAAVRGVVKDAQTGDLLIGITVGLRGTTRGAVTDTDGSFRIPRVPAGEATLLVSGIGYAEASRTLTIPESGEVTADFSLTSESTELAEVLVTGLRKTQIDAINVKRQALNNVEVLKVNDLGRLPDINVAEAAQRISGVSIETDNGEGRFISIRGIQPSLNNVTLNGGNLGSTANGRETPLDLLPVEMISSIEVVKANTPDMEGTGIGGAINIETITAFDRAEPEFFIASVDGLLQQQQADYLDDKFPYRLAVTGGKRFGENQNFGVVVSANYFRRDFSVSILDPDRWQYIEGTDPQGNPSGFLAPNEIEIQIEDNERERYGLTADLEFRPWEGSRIYLRSLYTHNDELDYNSEFELTIAGLRDQAFTNQTRFTGDFSQGSGELDLSSNDVSRDLYSFTLGTETRFGNLTAEVYGSYSLAESVINNIDGTYENDRDEEFLLAGSYNTEPFFFDITAADLEQARDPSIYYLR
ncbi:MAG: carboxypeptidase-like regulatory domain-containing protein, partial [Bacteroidota bacterium]